MQRYQLRRPIPVQIYPKRRFRRQEPAPSVAPPPAAGGEELEEVEEVEEVEEEGPESPDSPESSPSVAGASSSEDDSDSEDEEEAPSPVQSGAPVSSISAPASETAVSTLPVAEAPKSPVSSSAPSLPRPSSGPNATSSPPSVPSPPPAPSAPSASSAPPAPSASATTAPARSSSQAAFVRPSSTPGNVAAAPQVTVSSSAPSTSTSQPSAVTSSGPPVAASPTDQPAGSSTITTSVRQSPSSSESAPATSAPAPAPAPAPVDSQLPAGPAQSETAGGQSGPQKVEQEEPTMITRGAAAAAITLSILGAIAIMVAAVILFKRRKRRQNRYGQRVADDAFNPNNTGSLHAPETAHVSSDLPLFIGGGLGGGSHLTRSTERSNTLFGAGPYERPETVSTDPPKSRFPIKYNPADQPMPTPNPFVDPPLNKAYDVLAGRPRSTTLTDRGSWVKNPFKNPESERFDPFGELQEKARAERRKHMEKARIEAEEARAKEYEQKEAMGLAPPDRLQQRKGSDATFDGVGVLDRGGAGYR